VTDEDVRHAALLLSVINRPTRGYPRKPYGIKIIRHAFSDSPDSSVPGLRANAFASARSLWHGHNNQHMSIQLLESRRLGDAPDILAHRLL
jgi:hypothetical protein